jgi:hypothetical protein
LIADKLPCAVLVTDESRKRAADLNAVEAVVALFDQAPMENARLYSVAAMGQLALTGEKP